MNLHLTIQSKFVDSIAIDPQRRKDNAYIDNMKQVLINKHQHLLDEAATSAHFFLDRYHAEVPVLTSYA
jgi:hypothetical protein